MSLIFFLLTALIICTFRFFFFFQNFQFRFLKSGPVAVLLAPSTLRRAQLFLSPSVSTTWWWLYCLTHPVDLRSPAQLAFRGSRMVCPGCDDVTHGMCFRHVLAPDTRMAWPQDKGSCSVDVRVSGSRFMFIYRCTRKTARSCYRLRHVRPSACNNSDPTGWFFMKFDIWVFF